jgi:hypothetical protein
LDGSFQEVVWQCLDAATTISTRGATQRRILAALQLIQEHTCAAFVVGRRRPAGATMEVQPSPAFGERKSDDLGVILFEAGWRMLDTP